MAFCLHKLVNVACFMKYLLLISITNIDCPNRCFASCNKIFRMLKQILFSGFFCNYFFSVLTILILIFYFIQCVTPYFVLEKPARIWLFCLKIYFKILSISNLLIAMSHLAAQRCRSLSTKYARKCVNRIPICNCLL